jgi:glutathione S-transferase
MWSGCHW